MFGLRCKAKRLSITKKRRSKLFLQKQRAAIISKPCSTKHLTEEEIKQIFVKALNSLVEVKENVIAELLSLIDSICQTGKLMEEHSRVEQELCVLAERLIGTSDALAFFRHHFLLKSFSIYLLFQQCSTHEKLCEKLFLLFQI